MTFLLYLRLNSHCENIVREIIIRIDELIIATVASMAYIAIVKI